MPFGLPGATTIVSVLAAKSTGLMTACAFHALSMLAESAVASTSA
ncbi:Uncharacterised protein [Mycobacteroides abscessus subsp. abscessus]|nr:Uncharacterised protein [Mycobacteroides abscessus subsp. abscessus]